MKDLKASPKDKTLLYEWENAKATFKSKKDWFNIVEESNKGIKKRIEKLYKLRIRNKTREMKKRAKDLGKEIPKTENSGIVDYN
jgi:transaldolase